MPNRTVFFISDGTGITAETFGNAILAQFEITPRYIRLPFIDSVDKAAACCSTCLACLSSLWKVNLA